MTSDRRETSRRTERSNAEDLPGAAVAGPTGFVPADRLDEAPDGPPETACEAPPETEAPEDDRPQDETPPRPQDRPQDDAPDGPEGEDAQAEATQAPPRPAPGDLPRDAPEPGGDGPDGLATGCPPLDGLLDGGLERDAITLVFGEGGSGKTNLALQCARTATAAGQKVAYIDTEGVSAKRMAQVFDADPAASTDRLLMFSPFTIAEQEKMVEKTALLKDVSLIVVDSINMHYRLHIDGGSDAEKEAARSLFKQLHHLTGHARRHRVPVLVTGQVYGGEDETQPFARRIMEHMVKALIRFRKRPDGGRKATVLKHRSIEEGRQAGFRIGATGLEADP